MASTRKITLKSSDGEAFEVEQSVAVESQTIKPMIEDDCADNAIPLPNVNSKILAKVIEYCKKHVEASKAEDRVNDEDLKAWDAEFVKVDQATLFYLILAANYLNIKSLLDLTCQTVGDMIKGKTPEEICKAFNVKIYFTPEEEEEVRRAMGKIRLKSSDGEAFEVEQSVAVELQLIKCPDNAIPLPNVTSKILAKVIERSVVVESHTIQHLIEVKCADNAIPLSNVTSKILAKVIEYCKKHVEASKAGDRFNDEDLTAWDAEFVKVDQATLFYLILAANYLNIKSLLDLTCQTVADMIKGKAPEEIRKIFNIKNNTPEEEEELRRENPWAFE